MQEKLNQFKRTNVWTLVERPYDNNVIETKWIFKNKFDEHGVVVRNKERLVVQGYAQEEGISYDETFVPIVQLEAIRILLAFACYMDFKLYFSLKFYFIEVYWKHKFPKNKQRGNRSNNLIL